MSQPISQCMTIKAMLDEDTYQKLLEINKQNHINGGHYMMVGCDCNPSCWTKYKISQSIIDTYNRRAAKDWLQFFNSHDTKSCLYCNPPEWMKGIEGVPGIK